MRQPGAAGILRTPIIKHSAPPALWCFLHLNPAPPCAAPPQCLLNKSVTTSPSPPPRPPPPPGAKPSPSPPPSGGGTGQARTRTFRVVNKCTAPVWLAAIGNKDGDAGTLMMPTLAGGASSWQMPAGSAAAPSTLTLSVLAGTSGRLWGRTGCGYDATQGRWHCKTGDCAGQQVSARTPLCHASVPQRATQAGKSRGPKQARAWLLRRARYPQVCQLSGESPATLFEWTFTPTTDV